ncbi:MAG TPA: RluA family pseudouridine synthase [Candidatus Saccharimonadales bacterium]|nr:RluA family pseudouridine synthase [Candidatus Saccharimonadales bacterium]
MDQRSEDFIVEKSLPGERLDTFLRTRYPAVSRGAFQRLIEQGHIKVNDQVVKPTHRPKRGDAVQVFFPEATPAEAQPEDIPLDIIYEDADLLVVNKAPGLVVHPAAGNEEHTLVNALLHHCKGQLSGIGGVARPGIVHRLDKDTSGCLVVAKNDKTHVALAAQFAGRTLDKTYLAIVCGILPRDSGTILAAIARHPTHRKRMAVSAGEGREARTSYKVLERLKSATLVEMQLHTGRTHQIRVHFQHIGFPVAGDATYAAKQTKKLVELTGFEPPRVMLHSRTLAFKHPGNGKTMSFEAPVPEDFDAALAALR